MTLTTTTTLSSAMATYWSMDLMDRMVPLLVHTRYAKKGKIPRGRGKVMRVFRLQSLALNKVPLTEGSPPAGKALAAGYIDIPIIQLGDFVNMTDVVQTQVFDPLLNDVSEALGEQAGGSVEAYTVDKLELGTNVQFANGKANRAALVAADKYTAAEGMIAVRTLKTAKVRPFPDGYFRALIHPYATHDLRLDPRWIDAAKYADPTRIESGEIGRLDQIIYIESTERPIYQDAGTTGPVDVLTTLVFGPGAFACPSYEAEELGGDGTTEAEDAYTIPIKMIVKQLGSAGTLDPLDQQSTAGWKVSHQAQIIDDVRMVRVEHTSSGPQLP